jgi:arylsulfatase A-like enzyme
MRSIGEVGAAVLLLAAACAADGAAPPSTSGAKPPNILLFFPDELRYDFGGLTRGDRAVSTTATRHATIDIPFVYIYKPPPLGRLSDNAARSTSTTGGLHNNPYYTRAELPIFTPNFDRIAAGGVRFSRAFVGAPVCAPSRACLASGRQYDQNTVPMNFHNDFHANVRAAS